MKTHTSHDCSSLQLSLPAFLPHISAVSTIASVRCRKMKRVLFAVILLQTSSFLIIMLLLAQCCPLLDWVHSALLK